MSITSEISRLTGLRNNIRTKLISLGIISSNSADLSDLYTGINGIVGKAAAVYNTSSSDQTIASGQYLKGTQTIKAVTTSGISAANIKKDVVVKVGDVNDDDRITAVTGTFTKANTVSSGQMAAASGQLLSGYSAWVDGAEVKGSIATKTSSNLSVSGKTVTAAAGYYASDASASVATGTVTSGTATISSVSHAYNATNDNFDISGSANVSAPTVGTAGYISSSEGTRNAKSGGASVSASVSKIAGSTSITGASTKKPSIARTATTATGATNVGSGSASTTAPSSGYFVSVKSDANTGTLTATPSVSTAGYGTSANHGITGNTATVGASASDVTYITVPGGSATTPATTVTANPTITVDSAGLITASYSGSKSVTPTVSAGYVASGTAGTISTSGSNTKQLTTKAATTYNTSTSDQTIASGTYLTGTQTIRKVTTSGISAANIKDGAIIKVGDDGDDDRITAVTGTFTDAATVSSGQTAAAAAQIRSGYSAWVDGAEVKGSLGTTSVSQGTTTVSGTTATRGTATWGNGVISSGSIAAATFANTASSGVTYVDISGTTAAPALTSGGYLFINKGYTDNLKISLAKLVPDGASSALAAGHILSGYSAYNNDGTLIAGNIASLGATTYNTSSADQTIASGKYLSGTQTIKAVTTSGISAANIKHGTTVKVGDANDDDRIVGITGTFTKASTVSSGQTAAAAAQIRSGYSAWVDGAEVKGSIANGTITNNTSGGASSGTINRGSQIKIGAGYYASDAYYTAQANSGTVTVSASGNTSCDGKTTVSVPSATPAFDGGGLSGGSTATGTNVTLSTTDNGMKVQTAYTASRAAVLYNGAVNGWVSKADNAEALASGSLSSTNGTAYYVTGVTMPKDKGFTVTTTADTALDTTSDLDVTNNAYRRVDITNKANGTVLVANSGSTTVSSGSATAGALTVSAYNASGTAENNKSIVSGGKWVATSVSASGTYYGRVTVGSGSATTPATTITKNPTISISSGGLITASVSGTQSVTPSVSAGYVSSGTAGTITVSGSATSQMTVKAATTWTPGTTDQTIASGTYLTGTQTIKGNANLVAGNIKSGVTIFGVTGTYDLPSAGGVSF